MLNYQPNQVTLFSHPLLTIKTFAQVILKKIVQLLHLATKFWYIIAIFSIILITTHYIQSLIFINDITYFACYWILLGVASSIGLGTGLHTFVLYLGPHIAKVAVVGSECGFIPQMLPSRWNFNNFKQCANPQNNKINFFTILLAVQIESFLWGFGTALGQLPPYFIAKHAAQVADKLKQLQTQQQSKKLKVIDSRVLDIQKKHLQLQITEAEQQLSELQQIQKLQHKNKSDITLIDKIKLLIYQKLQKYGFITVLLCASIPNPLFDLAGITCGHFKIPFRTFFSATFIGKAIIKVHIQMLFVISLFRKQNLQYLISKVSIWLPKLQKKLIDIIQKQKKVLFSPEIYQDNKPIIGRIWDVVLISMILYFVISIINTSVQHELIQKKIKKQLDIKFK